MNINKHAERCHAYFCLFLSMKTFPQIIHVCQVKIRNTKNDYRFLKDFFFLHKNAKLVFNGF